MDNRVTDLVEFYKHARVSLKRELRLYELTAETMKLGEMAYDDIAEDERKKTFEEIREMLRICTERLADRTKTLILILDRMTNTPDDPSIVGDLAKEAVKNGWGPD